jgi:cysteinyl-tRNA synthetase
MVRYWLHNGLMKASPAAGKVGGRADRAAAGGADDAAGKISRSKGAGGLANLIATHGGEKLRFFLLRTHYRSTNVFGDEPVAEAGAAVDTFYRFFERYERVTGESFYKIAAAVTRAAGDAALGGAGSHAILEAAKKHRDAYLAAMDDDFNTAAAIAELFDFVRALNRFVDETKLEATKLEVTKLDQGAAADRAANGARIKAAVGTLRELTSLLGLFRAPVKKGGGADDELVAKLVDLLIEVRRAARKNKDFATGDKIRNDLATIGIVLEDHKEGTTWTRK